MIVAYLAHPFEGQPENVARCRRWLCWVASAYPHVAPIAPWLEYATAPAVRFDTIMNGAESPAAREVALARCCAIVQRSDELWLVGGRVSRGMEAEVQAARRGRIHGIMERAIGGVAAQQHIFAGYPPRVLDLTFLGAEPPAGRDRRADEIICSGT